MSRDSFRINPLGVLIVWLVSALIAVGLVELISAIFSIGANLIVLVGAVNWVSVFNISGGIFLCLILSVALYNAYQKSRIMRKHRSILDDVDSDFELKKEAYAEFLQEDGNVLTPDEDFEELENEYKDKRLSLNRGDNR